MVEDKGKLEFPCPYCPCIFSSQVDLGLHLTAFGFWSVSHIRLFWCVHALLDVYEVYSDVNSEGLFVVSDAFVCSYDGLPCAELVYVRGSRRRLRGTCLKCGVIRL